MCSTLLIRRLPLKSSRCLTGLPVPSLEDMAKAPESHQWANSGFAVEAVGVFDLTHRMAAMVPIPGPSRKEVP